MVIQGGKESFERRYDKKYNHVFSAQDNVRISEYVVTTNSNVEKILKEHECFYLCFSKNKEA